MNQAGQSLLRKEEEIKSVKEKFRDEKIQLQNENKRLLKQVDQKNEMIERVERHYRDY